MTTAGQRHDSMAFEPLMADLQVARVGPGRPRRRPDDLLADKAYSNKAIRSHLRNRRIRAVIPLRSDQQVTRDRHGKHRRVPSFDAVSYRERNVVERAVNKLRATRAVATRYDKRDYMYRGTVDVAAIRIWLRDPALAHMRDTSQRGFAPARPGVWRSSGGARRLRSAGLWRACGPRHVPL